MMELMQTINKQTGKKLAYRIGTNPKRWVQLSASQWQAIRVSYKLTTLGTSDAVKSIRVYMNASAS